MITIAPGNVYSYITYDRWGASPLKNTLQVHLKVDVPGAKYLWSYKSKQWDGKAQMWLVDPGSIKNLGVWVRTGLIPRLTGLFDEGGVPWTVWQKDDTRGLPTVKLRPTTLDLRPYQHEAIAAAFSNTHGKFGWWPRGVIEVATGGGKTEIAVAMYEMNPVPTFFLVHRTHLMLQAKERFEQYGIEAGIIGDSKFKPHPNLNIATMQTMKKIFEAPDSPRGKAVAKLMAGVKQVFFDEAHLMASKLKKGNEFIKVADHFDAPFRWGLTATPFKRKRYDNMLLEAVTGSSLYHVTTKQLVDLGYLTPPKVIMKHVPGELPVTFNWKKSRSNKARQEHWREVQAQGIKFNECRTKLILNEIEKGPFPMFVLTNTVEQANFINALWTARGHAEIPFLHGKTSSKNRMAAMRQMQEGSLPVAMVTTIFDDGVDVPNLRKVIFTSGGKSQVAMIQRVGRAVRKSPGKEVALIIDFQDGHHTKLREHAKERIRTYTDQEFEIEHEEV